MTTVNGVRDCMSELRGETSQKTEGKDVVASTPQ